MQAYSHKSYKPKTQKTKSPLVVVFNPLIIQPHGSTLCRFVTDATVAVFVAALLFVFPSKPPRLCHWRTQSSDTGQWNTYLTDVLLND